MVEIKYNKHGFMLMFEKFNNIFLWKSILSITNEYNYLHIKEVSGEVQSFDMNENAAIFVEDIFNNMP